MYTLNGNKKELNSLIKKKKLAVKTADGNKVGFKDCI